MSKETTADNSVERVARRMIDASTSFLEICPDPATRHEPYNCGAWWRCLARAAIAELQK